MNLSKDQIDFYSINGYLLIDSFLSDDAVSTLNKDLEFYSKGDRVNILNIHLKIESFFNLIKNEDIAKCAFALTDNVIIPVGSLFFFCEPNSEWSNGSLPHQDNYAAKSSYGSYMSIGVALDDADKDNGSLIVYPKSHVLRDMKSIESKNFEKDEFGKITMVYPIGNEVKIPEGFSPLQLEYKKGSIIFIHGHLIHSALPNPSKFRSRRKVYLNYVKDGEPFWPGWTARRQIIGKHDKFSYLNKI